MTTVLDRARAVARGGAMEAAAPPSSVDVKPIPVPESVKKRIRRAHSEMKVHAPRRRQNVEFARNNHFVWINKKGDGLDRQSTIDKRFGGTKPDHRVRRSHDILAPILKAKISAVTQRIPGYEVLEATSDPEDYSAARVSEKVLVSGYEIWNVRKAFRLATWDAFVTEEAFLMPFFDETIGPYVEEVEHDEEGQPVLDEGEEPRRKTVGMGEIRYAVFSGLEVGWQPGVQFEDARYYVIIHARPREQVEAEPDFMGPPLSADAISSPDYLGDRPKGADSDLVMVTDYLERPCAAQPNGRRIIEACGRQIFPEEDYPLFDQDGDVVDEPCLRRIAYAVDGESEKARGLVTSLIETVRDFDFASNKAIEYLQLVMVPQMVVPEGSILPETVIDDTPGLVVELGEDAWRNGMKPEWRQMPSMPGEFGNERDRAQALLGYIASENGIQGLEAAKAISAVATKDALAWQDFMEDVADAFAATGRDSLGLAQIYYDEARMVRFRGRTGWEAIPNFKGADIRGQRDVKVSVGSLEPLTRAVVEQRIMNVAAMFPGYFPPETIIAALSAGDFDRLNESYEEDEAQINFLIAQIRAGTFKDLPLRPVMPGEGGPELDPRTGQPKIGPDGKPVMLAEIEGWMPRIFDNTSIWKRRLEAFMKSDEWRHLPPATQQATGLVYNGVLEIEARNSAKQAAAQSQTAEALGAANAAKPQPAKAMPSLPAAAVPAGASSAE
jgi:hypothetical protein